MDRFIVTGTGRSGSRYVAALLRTLGIRCGHENVWPAHPGDTDGEWGDMQGEVGWPAALYLDDFDGRIVHVTRDPIKTINSRLLSRWYEPEVSNNPHYAPLYDRVDAAVGLRGLSVPDQAAKHYVEWGRMIDRYAHNRIRLESLNEPDGVQHLLWALGVVRPSRWIDFAVKAVPRDTNAHVKKQLVDWSWLRQNVSPGWLRRLEQTAESYGYHL